MKEVLTVFRAVLVRQLTLYRRYLFNTLSGLVTMYIVFMLLMTGARAIGGTTFMNGDAPLQSLVVGYLVWVFAMVGYQELAWGITNEAQMGTLEKLYLTPIGFSWVQGLLQLSLLIMQLGLTGTLLMFIMLTTGVRLQVDLVSVLPIILVTILAAYGLGFLMAGLGLVYKRVQSAFQILQFSLIGFLAAPASWGRFLPLNLGNRMLASVMVDGNRLWQLPAADWAALVFVNVTYLALGFVAFRFFEGKARELGLLGHY